ncbi:hypothetical protein GCM10010172_65750 [Paractinoplanes ferrugineus]|uniref:Transglutaminase-like domain-containing protein n=1 Tax=Paractinoplanes ferrugineus TaxID=113564 RepID=A0A919MFY1_9ACTN|nr:hypothetical protein Afe05nite_51040 [Actinoplanes ferrugineus]
MAEIMDRLTLVPDDARRFEVSLAEADRLMRLPADLIASMTGAGLRCRPSPGGPLFDRTDLMNVSMHLGTGSAAMAARRFWAAGLNPPPQVRSRPTTIYYQPRCPDPDHPGSCRFGVATPGGILECRGEPGGRAPVAEVTVEIASDWPALPPQVTAVLDTTAGLHFMFLPPALRSDLDFAVRTGLCACEGAARLLADEGTRRGLRARTRFGLIVAPPYSTHHNWAEFLVDDRWVPVDPVLLDSMLNWQLLRPDIWHRNRSIGPVVVGLSDQRVALATHNGSPAAVSLSTRRLAPVHRGIPIPAGPDAASR